ncbi:hypothetical protein D9M72_274210 [compost metagenome]
MVGQAAEAVIQAALIIDGNVGVGVFQGLAVAQVQFVAGQAFAVVLADGMGGIQGNRPGARIHARAQRIGLIAGGGLQPRGQRDIAGYAIEQGRAAEDRPFPAAAVPLEPSKRRIVADAPFPHHERRAGKSLALHAPAAVGLDDRDFHVPVGSGRRQIGDLERPRRDRRAVDQVAVLPHLDGCVRLGVAADHRRIALLVVGPHGLVRRQLHALELHAVEQGRVGVGLSDLELAFDAPESALQIGILALEFRGPAAAHGQVGIVAQPPGAQVGAHLQSHAGGTVVAAACAGGPVPAAVEAVVHERGGHAVFPKGGVHVSAMRSRHVGLRHAEVQAQARRIVVGAGLIDQFRQAQAGALQRFALGFELAGIHAGLRQEFGRKTGFHLSGARVDRKRHVPAACRIAVGIDIHAISAGHYLAAQQQRFDVRGLVGALQEGHAESGRIARLLGLVKRGDGRRRPGGAGGGGPRGKAQAQEACDHTMNGAI